MPLGLNFECVSSELRGSFRVFYFTIHANFVHTLLHRYTGVDYLSTRTLRVDRGESDILGGADLDWLGALQAQFETC